MLLCRSVGCSRNSKYCRPTLSLTHSLAVACPQSQFRWFERHRQRTDVQQQVLREIVDTLKYLINTESCLKSFIQVDGAIAQVIMAVPQPLERSVRSCKERKSVLGVGHTRASAIGECILNKSDTKSSWKVLARKDYVTFNVMMMAS